MKRLIIILFIALGAVSVKAQSFTPDKIDTLVLPHSKIAQLQDFIVFAYKWLPKSKAQALDVEEQLTKVQGLYNDLIPPNKAIVAKKDSTKVTTPKKK